MHGLAEVFDMNFIGSHARGFELRAQRAHKLGRSAEVRIERTLRRSRLRDDGTHEIGIHAIRAGITFGSEVDWIGARSIPEALDRLRAAAR